jgi:hypothetical protein
MAIPFSTMLIQPGNPDVSQMINPEAMLVTSVTVACLGLAVMMLARPRAGQLIPESVPESDNAGAAEEPKAERESEVAQKELLEASNSVMKLPREEAMPAAAMVAVDAQPVAGQTTETGAMVCAGPAELQAAGCTAARPGGEKLCEAPALGGPARSAAHGASALIAKVASLLPAGTAARAEKSLSPKPARGPAGFQPGARFSRSQQAFLRIPVVLTGRDEAGRDFREETCTVILLPQGAVIPMRHRVRAGDRLTLSNPTRQKDVACEVFGAQPGPDGRMLVEVEFPEPQKSMWPVSFPAWAGNSPSNAKAREMARNGGIEGTAAPDGSGS